MLGTSLVRGAGMDTGIYSGEAPQGMMPHDFQFHAPGMSSIIPGGLMTGAPPGLKDASILDSIGFGGYMEDNDPVVYPESNNSVHIHFPLDKSQKYKPYDSVQDDVLVMFRNYAATSVPRPAGVPRKILSLQRFNWYMQHGEGRGKYGRLRNAQPIMDDFQIIGSRTSAAYDENSSRVEGSEQITIIAMRRARVRNYWAVDERNQFGVITNHVQQMDSLFFLMVRVHEENPYGSLNPTKDPESEYYWRFQPHRTTLRKPGWFEYNSEGVDPFVGYEVQWGYMHQQLDRFGGNPQDQRWATEAVYPQEDSGEYIDAMKHLPNLETYHKCV